MLALEPGTLHMLASNSTTELCPQLFFCSCFREKVTLYVTQIDLQSPCLSVTTAGL